MSQLNIEAEGNTSTSASPRIRARRWSCTLNNYTAIEYEELIVSLKKDKYFYIVGKEIGEGGTPHLQIYLESRNQTEFNKVKKLNPRLHIEKSKGSKESNIKYCSKDNDFVTNFEIDQPLKRIVLWKEWQFRLKEELLNNEPDGRTIYWYWSESGGTGKSSFVKHMLMETDSMLVNKGKHSDMINQVFMVKKVPPIILIDIPRSMNSISYAALEEIKNGMVANSKYETGFKLFNPPHIVVFSNFCNEKLLESFSSDRLNIVCLDENQD